MDIEDVQILTTPTCEQRCIREKIALPVREKLTSFEIPTPPTEDDVVSEARRGCNLRKTAAGPIKTNMIQVHAVRKFREFNIPPLVPASIGKKVAVIGAGPSGLSCASFLRRFGIDVTIFEKESFAGGIMMKEILSFRVPKEDIDFEIELVKQAGVEFQFNKKLGVDMTVDSLLKDGYNAVYLAFGKPESIKPPMHNVGAIDWADFLHDLNGILKFKNGKQLPDWKGKKVCVLGSGGTAADCASAASRLGGEVTIACFEDFKSMPAPMAEIEKLLHEGIEFMTLVQVTSIDNGEVKFETVEHLEDGTYKRLGEFITRKFDEVIVAFGATMKEARKNIPGELNVQKVEGYDNVFAGGDICNTISVIEAVNDGKVAAGKIADLFGIKDPIPMFTTEVDNVSLETEICGIKFPNPVGISSGEVSATYECVRNSLLAGNGWATTKTILLSKDLQRDNDMRIVKCEDNPFHQGCSFMNIAMMSEHSAEYWFDAVRKLKKEFPDRVIVASISATDNKDDWHEVVKRACEAGADALELNLSCPNEVHGKGGHKGGFDSENKIGMALGVSPINVKRIAEYVKEVTTVPFFVKITPNVTSPVDLAKAAYEGGANGVAMINTVAGISRFFPDGTPLPQVGTNKFVLSGGLSGELIRPIALRQISKVHLSNEPMPILGMGGIWSADTAMQHLYAGSSVFALCSATIRYSYEITREIQAGLKFLLYAWSRPDLRSILGNYNSDMMTLPHKVPKVTDTKPDRSVPTLAEMRGAGSKRVVQRESLDACWTVNSKIDHSICVNCGKCAYTCRDNGNIAISKQADGTWEVDVNRCVGCGACVSVCPLHAISLVKSPTDKPWHWNKE
ncbi:putative dihydropyrimidine dehydrogenase [Histomonas meleagridis]|uniref:putative dihydropyrimidine dehydrogenase n=1 Tax=Histomonas meleagridis TaxID=135588 RepID=UPI00355A310A|nr:putative dihydropyrimidine dehydrogenase [Histomonas meleagridis]KAH0804624.1 putative dihydropyrimidine dehydrogenase [Histomonas meleagridis]